MMVKVLVYAYCVGVPSSRKIEKQLHQDIAFRVLAANNTPDLRTISDFRKDHLEALGGLFLQVLQLCQQAGLMQLDTGFRRCEGSTVRNKVRLPCGPKWPAEFRQWLALPASPH